MTVTGHLAKLLAILLLQMWHILLAVARLEVQRLPHLKERRGLAAAPGTAAAGLLAVLLVLASAAMRALPPNDVGPIAALLAPPPTRLAPRESPPPAPASKADA
jgi:hypothetical protein